MKYNIKQIFKNILILSFAIIAFGSFATNISAESIVESNSGQLRVTYPDPSPDGLYIDATGAFIIENGMYPGETRSTSRVKVENLSGEERELGFFLTDKTVSGNLANLLRISVGNNTLGNLPINNVVMSSLFRTPAEISSGDEGVILDIMPAGAVYEYTISIVFPETSTNQNNLQNLATQFDVTFGFTDYNNSTTSTTTSTNTNTFTTTTNTTPTGVGDTSIEDLVVTIDVDPDFQVQRGTLVRFDTNVDGGFGNLTYLWEGFCQGTNSFALLDTEDLEPGEYDCTVTVTDENGDTSIDTVTITVTEGLILGLQSCDPDSFSNVYGRVYYDSNANNAWDESERGQSSVTIEIYALDEDGERKLVTRDNTDDAGEWNAELCPGEYYVLIDQEDIPSNATLIGDEELTIQVDASQDLEDVNFALEIPSSFNWWLCLVGLLVLVLLIAGGYILTRERDFEK